MSYRFIIIGTGWRAAFYYRIIKALPNLFSLSCFVTTKEERVKDVEKQYNSKCYSNLDDALKEDHDGVILAVKKDDFMYYFRELANRNESALVETTFTQLTNEEREECLSLSKGKYIQTAEQYPYWPLYESLINIKDIIGPISYINLSSLHQHHASSIARKVLDISDVDALKIRKNEHTFNMIKTSSRLGRTTEGVSESYRRVIAEITTPDNKLFFYDFCTNLYHSKISFNSISIKGERGTILDNNIKYLSKDNEVLSDALVYHRDGEGDNSPLSLSHVTFAGKVVYRNPFKGIAFNDDEIALAKVMKLFSEKVDFYSAEEGIKDGILGCRLQ